MRSPFGIGIGAVPLVPSPSTEAERTQAAAEAGKVAKLLARPTSAQVGLLQHLADSSREGFWFITSAQWLDTILKATKGFTEAEVAQMYGFDWTERVVPARELRRELESLRTSQKGRG